MQPQNHVIATEQPPENQTGNEPIPFLNYSNKYPTDILEQKGHTKTTLSGDTTIPVRTITTALIEEELVRDELTNELYLPITSTVVLKRQQHMLYVPLDFKGNLTVDALVDSGAYVSAIAQKKLNTIKQKTPNKFPKMDDIPNFQIQVANRRLEKNGRNIHTPIGNWRQHIC